MKILRNYFKMKINSKEIYIVLENDQDSILNIRGVYDDIEMAKEHYNTLNKDNLPTIESHWLNYNIYQYGKLTDYVEKLKVKNDTLDE